MDRKFRIIAITLIAAMLIAIFVSCDGNIGLSLNAEEEERLVGDMIMAYFYVANIPDGPHDMPDDPLNFTDEVTLTQHFNDTIGQDPNKGTYVSSGTKVSIDVSFADDVLDIKIIATNVKGINGKVTLIAKAEFDEEEELSPISMNLNGKDIDFSNWNFWDDDD